MKIAFDSQIFTMQEYGGISRYICSLAAHLEKMGGVEVRVIAPWYINAYLAKLPGSMVCGIKVPKIPKTGRFVHQASLWFARWAIAKFEPQIVHETYYSECPIAPRGARTVVTVYDMIHERFPESFSAHDRTSAIKKASVLRADHVICISENTRRDLLESIEISPDKVSVVHLGFDRLAALNGKEALRAPIMVFPYLLYVGGRENYKNFHGLLQAYASSDWLMKNFRIVCVGGGKLRAGELEQMRELGISSERVEQINADDDLLACLYKNAAAFIYPSRYEGFGIPPLEAMSMACPVICSNSSSIPEVVGNAGEYFDPDDTDSMRAAIEGVLQSNDRRESLIQKGMERGLAFSWERCATETLAIYRSMV